MTTEYAEQLGFDAAWDGIREIPEDIKSDLNLKFAWLRGWNQFHNWK